LDANLIDTVFAAPDPLNLRGLFVAGSKRRDGLPAI
jgi:hypothetical protein